MADVNDYEETLDQAPAPAGQPKAQEQNPYLDTLNDQDQTGQVAMRKASLDSSATSPDRAAETRRLSLKLGVPPAIIDRNFDSYKKQDAVDQPYEKIQTETPHTAQWLGDPNNAAIAKDDLQQLGTLEWLFTAPQRAFAQGVASVRAGQLRTKLTLDGQLSQAEHDEMESQAYAAQNGGKLGAEGSWFRTPIVGAAQFLPMLGAMAKYGVAGALEGAAAGGAAGSILPGAGTIAGAVAGGGYGLSAGLLYGGAKVGFQLATGQAHEEYSQIRDEAGRPLDPNVTKAAAIATGIINAGLMTIPLEKIAGKPLEALTASMTRNVVGAALKSPTIRGALLDAVRSYGGSITAATATMIGMRAVTILGGEVAKREGAAGPVDYRSPSDVFGDLMHEGINAAEQFALVSAAGPVMELAKARGDAVHAQAAADYFTALGKGMADSKAAQRAPAAVQELIKSATKDGPIPAVYAPLETWSTYWQEKGVDPAEMAKHVTGDADAYAIAQRDGTDLKIPTERYATTIAPTEHNAFFSQELRLGPDEMNAREGKAFVDAQQQAAKEAAQAELTPRQQIRQQITERLGKAGVQGTVAESYADLIEAGVGTMAEHAGLDPAEVYQSYGLQVERPDLSAPLGATGAEGATGVAGEAAASNGGQVAPEAGAVPLDFGPDAYAGPERRAEAGAGPDGLERRAAAEPIASGSTPEGVREAAKVMRAENPQIDQQAGEMRARAASVERPSRPRSYAGAISGVDRKLEAAHAALRDAAAEEDRARAGEEGPAAVRSIAPSAPVAGERESAAGRAARRDAHFEQLHTAVADAAKRLDPNVDEAALRAEVDSRAELLADLDRDYAESGSNPRTILKAIADAGGLSLKAEEGDSSGAGYSGELKWTRESQHHGPFGAFGGVRGVFRTRKGERGLAKTGLSLDDMARMLSQDYPDIQTPNDVLAVLEDVSRFGAEKTKTDVYPGTAALGIDLQRAWWKPAEEDADISFNVSEFGQGLFDAANEALAAGAPDEKLDTLDTGEQQARLPGAGEVREQNVATPEVAEAPFSLTPPENKGSKGKQSTLFQSAYHGSPHKFDEFSLHAIGSGEGAQAYGWGLYFASKREIADRYRESLAGKAADKRLEYTDERGARGVYEPGGIYTTLLDIRDHGSTVPPLDTPEDAAARANAARMVQGLTELHGRAHFLPPGKASIERMRADLVKSIANMEKAEAKGETFSGSPSRDRYDLDNYRAALEALDRYGDKLDIAPPQRPGRTYTVDIPEDDQFLSWDEPASKQSPKVQEALKALGVTWEPLRIPTTAQAMRTFNSMRIQADAASDIGIRGALREGLHYATIGDETAFAHWYAEHQGLMTGKGVSDPIGEDLYDKVKSLASGRVALENLRPRAQAASEALGRLGVAGIRYLDGFSRDKGQGSSNYVVFDPKLAPIVEYDQAAHPLVNTPAFHDWFGESKVVDEESGEPLVVYHGTQRLDRFGPELRKSRATSGPMPFFTADKEVASNYATHKADTSLANEDVHGYESYFRLKPEGRGAAVNLDRAWHQLTPEQRAKVAELAPRVMSTDQGDIVLGPADHKTGTGGYDQHIKEARGNHFQALIEEWLNSGNLFNDERSFEKVLQLAGAPVDRIEFHDPYADKGGVAPVYLAIKNPLDTSKMTPEDIAALETAAARQRKKPNQTGADFWDKTTRDPQAWVDQLKEDQAKGVNSFVWSSVPDWVTKTLKGLGYDGIHDTGGKMGGKEHDVWVPFEPEQVKSAIGNRGTFDPNSRNILKQERRGSISFGADRQFTINLFAKADLSTFLHESGHFFLEVFTDLANRVAETDAGARTETQQRLLGDHAAIMDFLKDDDHVGPGFSTKQHEQFARAFESYLFEGKAPSLELQSAFSRFRAWLLGVYRSLKNLKAPLTDEVRGVFDRMLATDQSIAAAESRGRLEPMFTTAESAGMTESQFSLYRDTVAKASQTAREKLDAKLLHDVRREQEANWKAQREEVRAGVATELGGQREYQALSAMRKGTRPDGSPIVEGLESSPMKLSRAILVDRYGKDRVAQLPKGITTSTGGLEPDVVAEHFGFSSGDEMLTRLAATPDYKAALEQETNRRMVQQHGSTLLDGTLPEKAQAAAANEDRDIIVRAELKALAQLRRTAAPFEKQAKAEGAAALKQAGAERDYERRWLEAEAKLRIAIAEGHKQVEIDALRDEARNLKQKARGGPAVIRGAIPPAAMLKAQAEARIAGTLVRDLSPATFWSASRKAAQQAIERAARQDFDGAIEAKTAELVHLNLYREAERAKDDVAERVARMSQLSSKSTRAMLGFAGEAYSDQVDGILDRYEFSRVPEKVLARRANIRKFVEGLEGQGLPVDLPAEVLNDARRINYRDVSYAELVGVTDGVAQILHLARLKNKLLTAIDAREFKETATNIVDSINANGKARPAQLEILPKDKLARNVDGWFASHTKLATFVDYLDGGEAGGPFWEAFMRPINEAATRQETMHEEAAKKLTAILRDAYSGRDLAKIHEREFIPAIGGSLSKEARLAVALNWGNEGNRQRLMESARHWNAAQVQAILDTLDERDLKFVQNSLDYVNSFRDQIGAKEKRVTGLEPEWVEPASWNHSQFGEQKGGYYPIVYDGRLSLKQGNIIDADAGNLQQHANYAYATTKRGYLEAREARVNAPVRLELSAMYEHVEQVIHDLSHHETLIDVGRLMADRGIQQAILSRQGDIVYKQMRGALLDIALGTRQATTSFDRAVNFIRSGVTISGIAWNPIVALHHLAGIFNGAAEVGVPWVARGAMRVFRDAASMESTARWINEKSEAMRLRNDTADRDVRDLRTTLARAGGWFDDLLRTVTNDKLQRDDIVHSYSALLGSAIKLASLPTWIGAYEKALADTPGAEARAIAMADQAVENAHGSGLIKDMAEVQRGGALSKLFTTFYTYGNLTFNQTAREFGRTNFRQVGSVGQMLVNLSLIYTLPAAFAVAINQASGRDRKGETFGGLLGREALAMAMNTMVGVRELGGAAQMLYQGATGVEPAAGNRGYEGPTGLRLVTQIEHLAQQINKAGKDGVADSKLVRSVEDVAGVLFHLPIAQVQRSIDGFAALQEGKTANPAALLVGAPKEKK